MTTATRMPSLFIPHGGGPCFFMDWNPPDMWVPMGNFLKGISATLPEKPKAILLISGHWEGPAFTVGSNPAPGMVYDYYGFPPHTYQLKYPSPGNPELAARVTELLTDAGLPATEDPVRGYDHGVFIPLLLMFPDADIPVVQLSLRSDYDAAAHIAAGHALETLRDEGVLIVGSGMSFHNLPGMRDPSFVPKIPTYAKMFDDWLNMAATATPQERDALLADWDQAPAARLTHPHRGEDHLLPLMVAAGAAGDDQGQTIFNDDTGFGILVSGFRFG